MLLENMTTNEVKEYLKKDCVIIIPVGSTEQHGPANPLGTDFIAAQYIAREASKKANIICAPTIPIGVSEHHKEFTGSLWVRPTVYMEFMKQYISSILHHGFTKIIVINGHGGNSAFLTQIANEIFYDENIRIATPDVLVFFDFKLVSKLFPDTKDVHAEAIETSLNLAINPTVVKEEELANVPVPPTVWGLHLDNISLPAHLTEFAPYGIVGSLKNISKESGEKVLESAVNNLVKFINDFRNF
ncbi:MAG: creatininase family protein [Asgard group archaeon]|nr:creatininase family protein [Asgard group archaeon]